MFEVFKVPKLLVATVPNEIGRNIFTLNTLMALNFACDEISITTFSIGI